MKPLEKRTRPGAEARLVYGLQVLALALAYHLAARLGLKMAYVQMNTSPVWPPTGIALAALLIFGYRFWPAISLAVLAGSLLTGADPGLAFGMALGNTLEALAGAYLLRRFVGFHNAIDRIRDVVGLAVVAIFSTAISATVGTATLLLSRLGTWEGLGALWSTWWIGDLLGALVVAPVLLVWISPSSLRPSKRLLAEGPLLLLLLLLVGLYVFGGKPPDGVLHQALIYLLFPFIIWAALRFGQHGAATTTFIISGIAIWGTVQGLGPFSLGSKNDSLVLLQTFLAVVSLTGLILAAATLERRNAAEGLRQRAEELATLNDSSKTFLDGFDVASLYHTICRVAVTRLGPDVVWIETPNGQSPAAFYGLPLEAIAAQKVQWERGLPAPQAGSCRIETIDQILPAEPRDLTYQSFAAFPLTFGGRPIATLEMLSKGRDFFSEEKQNLIQSYANLAAVAIQNTWLFDEVRTTNRQLHALSQRLMQAQEAERLHLSRELHDESGQLLAALTVQLGLLDRDADHPESVRSRTVELNSTANTIRENLHRLAVHLRPASLDHLGLMTALDQFIQEFSRQNNIRVDFESVGMREQSKRLPIEIETALFRIVQESLTNVVLHARASRVDVLLNLTGGCISAVVEDDGVGFIPGPAAIQDHLGLFGMQERVEMLGGTLTVESGPGKGTTVKAEVPIHD